MSRLSNYLILVTFYLATIIVKTTLATNEQESLFGCRRHVGSHCGNKIVEALSSVDSNQNSNTSTECCYKMIQMGYSCHTRLAVFVLQNDPIFKHKNWTHVLQKNDIIFNECDDITRPANGEFLSKCVEKIGTTCGVEIFNKLIHNKNNGVTKHCCGKLVRMGLSCHINMAKALIRTPEMRDVDAIEFLRKSKELFHQCLPVL